MDDKVRWGVLGAANIALKKVILAMQAGESSQIVGIASRNSEKAKRAAQELGIPKFYGSYEELLADAEIEAVYNPLLNHLHLEWTIKATEAGKHVLCEKPLGMNAAEVRKLIEIRNHTGVKIQEAFMVRTHPVWLKVKELIKEKRIGDLQLITGFFSYFNNNESNIRNNLEMGGGALLDIGCYCANMSRFIFEEEPQRVTGLIARDEKTRIDKLTSAMMDFPRGQATFTCSTQLAPFQRMQFFGTTARIEVQIPFNIPPDSPTRIYIDNGSNLFGQSVETIEIPTADQYTIQGDVFSKAIRQNAEQAIPLEDSFANMAVIDAIFRAAQTGNWEAPEKLSDQIND